MKNSFVGILLVCLAVLNCRGDEDSIQNIDQIMGFYIKDASGRDMLKPNAVGSFTTISMNDMLATKDVAPVSYTRKTTSDSINYLEYIAGATRELQSGSGTDDRVYRSKILVALTKKITDSTFANPTSDTLEIFYRWTPTVFEVSRVSYNKQQIFTKVQNQPNNVTIIK